jgi:hypothetical protein
VTSALRLLRETLAEVRDGQTLKQAHRERLNIAIAHISAILDDADPADIQGVEQKPTGTTGTRSLRAELVAMKRNKPKPPPATAEQIAWEVVRLRHQGAA